MDYKKLDELNKLRLSGALTDEEFEREKQKLFGEEAAAGSASPESVIPMGLSESSYLALMNFLIFVPYIGWIVPIVMWSIGKNTSPKIDQQGKYILNWYITWFIFGLIFAIASIASLPALMFTGGSLAPSAIAENIFWILPLAAIIGVLCIAFPIIGGIRGLSGQTWKYPLSIPFLK